MGEGKLPVAEAVTARPTAGRWSIAVVALVMLAPSSGAQPKSERITYSWIMELRQQLWLECRDKSPEVLQQVATDLVSDARGNVTTPLARALARVRGVEADSAFAFRRGVHCLATPEVVDVDRFEHVHLTMHMPYRVAVAGRVTFRARILAPDGEQRWSGEITQGTDVEDLLRYRATVQVPVADLPDGRYRVEVETLLDGVGPRPGDPRSRAVFCVLRGFPARLEALLTRVAELRDGLEPATLLVVNAALARLRRLFVGEPREGHSTASDDLRQAEAIVDNVANGRPSLHGLQGWVTIAVGTAEDEAAMVSVRLPARPAAAARPLVLFVPGAPAWDQRWSRPTSPRATSPHWLRDVLEAQGFDRDERFLLAVMESPGRVKSSDGAIAAVVADLRKRFGLDAATVLIGEREGAAALTRALTHQPDLAGGFALVCGGSLDRAAAKRLAGKHVLAAPGLGHLGNVNLERAVTLLRAAGGDVQVMPAKGRAWPIAVPLLLPAIEALARAAVE